MKMEKGLIDVSKEDVKELCESLKKHMNVKENKSPIYLETDDGVFECDSFDDVVKIIYAKILHEESKENGGNER